VQRKLKQTLNFLSLEIGWGDPTGGVELSPDNELHLERRPQLTGCGKSRVTARMIKRHWNDQSTSVCRLSGSFWAKCDRSERSQHFGCTEVTERIAHTICWGRRRLSYPRSACWCTHFQCPPPPRPTTRNQNHASLSKVITCLSPSTFVSKVWLGHRIWLYEWQQ